MGLYGLLFNGDVFFWILLGVFCNKMLESGWDDWGYGVLFFVLWYRFYVF